ncbi:TPA: GGDEF domain-containing protein [Escherichia coli]|nr:GGDEF domain-containing protein [Escherichia coli]
MFFILCILLSFLLGFMPHNLSSYNTNCSFMLTNYLSPNGTAIWGIRYINILIMLWIFMLYVIIKVTNLNSSLWNSIIILCISALTYNFLLLFLDRYNLSIWYISRAIEVFSKIFIIGSLMHTVFAKLNIINSQVMLDTMTQIYNRNYFFDQLDRLTTNTGNKNTCVMIIDLDNFKKINDSWGGSIGDRVILAIVEIIKKIIKKDDVFSRLGGEEFGLILRNVNIDESKKIAHNICNSIKIETGIKNSYNIPTVTTISIGGVYVHKGIYLSSKINQIIHEADS